MASLLDFFGTIPKAYGGLLDEEDLLRLKQKSQQDALLTAAGALLAAGAPSTTKTNTGLALLQGLQAGRTGFDTSMTGGLQNALTIQKLQEAQQAKAREKQVTELLPRLFGQQATGEGLPVTVGGMPQAPTAVNPISPNMSIREGMEPTGSVEQALGKLYSPSAEMSVPQIMGPASIDDALQQLLAIGGAEGLKGVETYAALRDINKPEYFTAGNTVLQRTPEGLSVAYQAEEKPDYTSDYKNYLANVAQGYKGSFMDYQTSLKREGAIKLDLGQGQKGYDNENKLRSDFRSEPVYKTMIDGELAYKQVMASIEQNTPIGDTAAATKIMKLLDPGSVVRETELGMAMAATGKLDRLKNFMDLWISGKSLSDNQRTEFASLAKQLYNAGAQAYNKKWKEYKDQADRWNINSEVLGSPAKIVDVRTPEQAAIDEIQKELRRRKLIK